MADLAPPAEAPLARSALLKAGLLFVGLAVAGLAARGLGAGALSHPPATVKGALAFAAVGGLLAGIGVPRQAVAFAGGYAFGAWRGGALSLAAQLLGCMADFWWARLVARDWARQRLQGRWARADRFLAARPFAATLTLRLLPVGNNLALNLAAGVSGLRAGPFLSASLIGYLPQTAVFALAGSGVHVDRSVQLALGAALFGASALLGWALLRSGAAQPAPAPLA